VKPFLVPKGDGEARGLERRSYQAAREKAALSQESFSSNRNG